MAFFDKRIRLIIKGINNGKLNTAISVELLPALEAIDETMVRTIEKPVLPKIKQIRNIHLS